MAGFAPDTGGALSASGARDDSGDRHQRLKASARAKLAQELAKSERLTPLRRRQYREAAEDLIEQMPSNALELWQESFRGINFYPTADEVNEIAVAIKRQSGQKQTQENSPPHLLMKKGKPT